MSIKNIKPATRGAKAKTANTAWRIAPHAPGGHEVEGLDNGNCWVLRAKVYGSTEQEIRANAALIAAAPELLDALKLLSSVADSSNIAFDGSNVYAKMVIARAEGRDA